MQAETQVDSEPDGKVSNVKAGDHLHAHGMSTMPPKHLRIKEGLMERQVHR